MSEEIDEQFDYVDDFANDSLGDIDAQIDFDEAIIDLPEENQETPAVKTSEPIQTISYLERSDFFSTAIYGQPTCLAAFEDLIAMGFDDSKVLLIKDSEKIREFVIPDLSEKVTCIDFNQEHMVVGYANGLLVSWNVRTGGKIKSVGGVHIAPITAIRLLQQRNEYVLHFASGDYNGNVYWIKVRSLYVVYTFDIQRLIPKLKGPCIQIARAQSSVYGIISVSSLHRVLTLCIYPSIKLLYDFRKPKVLGKHIQPNICWGSILEDQQALVICWGYFIQILTFNILTEATVTPKQENYLLHYVQKDNIIYCSFIAPNTLIVFDDRYFKILYIPLFLVGQQPMISQFDLEYGDNEELAKSKKSVQYQMRNEIIFDTQQFAESINKKAEPEIFYQNTIRCSKKQRTLYGLENIKLKLHNWDEYLKSEVFEQLNCQPEAYINPNSFITPQKKEVVSSDESETPMKQSLEQAFRLDEQGCFQQAVENFSDVFLREVELKLQKQNLQKVKRIQRAFDQILLVCSKAVQSDEKNKVIYQQVLKKIFAADVTKKLWLNIPYVLQKKLNLLFAQLFITISKEIQIQVVLDLFQKNPQLFSQYSLRPCLQIVIESVGWECKLLQRSSVIFINDNISVNVKVSRESSSSPGYDDLCSECFKPANLQIKNDIVVLMKCGHVVHQICMTTKFCGICQNSTVESMMSSLFEEERKRLQLREQYSYLQPWSVRDEQPEEDIELCESFEQLQQNQIKEQMTLNRMQAFDSISEDYHNAMEEFSKKYMISYEI